MPWLNLAIFSSYYTRPSMHMGVSLETVKKKTVPVFFLYTQYFTCGTSGHQICGVSIPSNSTTLWWTAAGCPTVSSDTLCLKEHQTHRWRVQSHRTPPLQTPTASPGCHLYSDQMATEWRFQWPSPWVWPFAKKTKKLTKLRKTVYLLDHKGY